MNHSNTTFGHQYITSSRLAAGSFGVVYLGHHRRTHKLVAIKCEPADSDYPQLLKEAKILKLLQSPGFPKIYWVGTQANSNAMVMELLGPSLEEQFFAQNRTFSVKTVTELTDQMLKRIQKLHENGLVHRDIKPENWMMGLKKKSQIVYLIDFGLAKFYRDKKGCHFPERKSKEIVGTSRYVSVNVEMGVEASRRDDLESLGYMVAYFLNGTLPWVGVCETPRTKLQETLRLKLNTSVNQLFAGFPDEFVSFMTICRSFKFEETPDYKILRRLLRRISLKQKFVMDSIFDWTFFFSEEKEVEIQNDSSIQTEICLPELRNREKIKKRPQRNARFSCILM